MSTSLIRYIQLVKKGNKYEKVTDENDDQQWDLTTLLDMMFSFWMLTPISDTDPRAERLREAGIW